MNITKATIEDAAQILELQKLAFQSEAAINNDYSIAPLHQTLEDLQKEFSGKTVLKAMLNDRMVGSVRAWERDGSCYIERLVVHPDCQGHGIGTSLMYEVEACFPAVKRFELFTGHKSERNIRLYQRLGYQVFKHQQINNSLSFVFMEKLK